MKLAVISSPESWYFRDLLRASANRHDVRPLSFASLCAYVGCGVSPGIQSQEYAFDSHDAVLVRTMPPGTLEQIVFRMDALAVLESAGVPVVNAPKALETAIDKYLALSRLSGAGLPVPRTIVCQTYADAMRAFEELRGDVVVKPLFGSEGKGIARLNDVEMAHRAFRMLDQFGAVIYLQEFICHEGFDLRILAVGDELFAMRRRNEDDWRTNISRGGTGERTTLSLEIESLARQAAAAVGATLAGVDLLTARDGSCYVLEVNAVPGWRALSRVLDVDIASHVIQFCERAAKNS